MVLSRKRHRIQRPEENNNKKKKDTDLEHKNREELFFPLRTSLKEEYGKFTVGSTYVATDILHCQLKYINRLQHYGTR